MNLTKTSAEVAQIIEAVNPTTVNGLNLCFVFGNLTNKKDLQVLSFQLDNDLLSDPEIQARTANEIMKNIFIAHAMDTDPLLQGKVDNLKVYSGLKRNIPNRQCSLFLKSNNEILSTYMGGKKIPTSIMHNPKALLQVLGYCFQIGQPVEAIKLELPNKQATTTTKLVNPETEARRKELELQRKEIVDFIKEQQRKQAEDFMQVFRPNLTKQDVLPSETKSRLELIKEAKKALK